MNGNGSSKGATRGIYAFIGCIWVWLGSCAYGEFKATQSYKPTPLPAPASISTAYVPPPPGEVHASGGEPTEQTTDLSAYQGSSLEGSYGGHSGGYGRTRVRSYRRGEDGVARTERVSGYFNSHGTYVNPYNRRPRRR